MTVRMKRDMGRSSSVYVVKANMNYFAQLAAGAD